MYDGVKCMIKRELELRAKDPAFAKGAPA